jgi:hypothetical protein
MIIEGFPTISKTCPNCPKNIRFDFIKFSMRNLILIPFAP